MGLHVEPAQEALWRLRILSAHQSADPALEAEAITRLTTLADRLDIDLEPETEELLTALDDADGTPGHQHLRAL